MNIEVAMIRDIKTTARRSSATLAQDFAGAAALVLMLVMALNLPVFI